MGTKKQKSVVWGSADYLKQVFDDITTAVKCPKNSGEYMAFAELVNGISNKRNNAYVYQVHRTKGTIDGRKVENCIGHLVIGLNGGGRDADYFAALAKLMRNKGVAVLDAHIDAADDIWDFLIGFNGKEAK